MAPSLAVLAIAEVFCESLLYGVYCVLFTSCMRILVFDRKERVKISLLAVSLALFICITIHEIVDAGRLLWVFSTHSSVAEVDAWYSAGLTKIWNILNNSVYVIETVVSDLFLLYRCYVVWGKKLKVITIPALVFLVDMGAGMALPISLSRFKGNTLDNPSFVQKQERIDTTFFSSTFALNAMCTGLIAFRILRNSQFKNKSGSARLSKVAVVIIESGAIYLINLALLLSTYVHKSTLNYVFLDIVVPTIGIVFSLIIVRVALNISYEASNSSNGPTAPTIRFTNNAHSTIAGRGTMNRDVFSLVADHRMNSIDDQHMVEPQSSSGTLKSSKRGEVMAPDVPQVSEKPE